MRIIFTKSCVFNRKYRAVGSITTVTQDIGAKLMVDGVAKIYTGEYPPKGKTHTDFFKPKDLKQNGKEHGQDRGERGISIPGGGANNLHDGGDSEHQ